MVPFRHPRHAARDTNKPVFQSRSDKNQTLPPPCPNSQGGNAVPCGRGVPPQKTLSRTAGMKPTKEKQNHTRMNTYIWDTQYKAYPMNPGPD